jgi:hypothetical protein
MLTDDGQTGSEAPGHTAILNGAQRSLVLWVIIAANVIGLMFVVATWVYLVVYGATALRDDLLAKHFAAVVGLPLAGVGASSLIVFFSHTSGHMEFEVLTIKFKGAAGPLILWCLCFLSIVSSIKLLW